MTTAVDKLLSTRSKVGIPPENLYLFARPFSGSLGYIRALDCLRSIADQASLEAPSSIRSTRLRKYIATVTQVFNLKENETDWLARHLGHDIRVHRDFYRLHESAIELTKVSRLLLAVDEGKVEIFSGKSLEDINLNDLPEIDNESSEESDTEAAVKQVAEPQNSCHSERDTPIISSRQRSAEKKTCVRRKWLPDEIKAVTKFFHLEIRKSIVPGKARIMECKEKHACLEDRTWKDIKYYVKNFITKLDMTKKKNIRNDHNVRKKK